MFKKLLHPKQNQDPTLYEKSWGVFRLGRISARAIIVFGTILVFLGSNWAGNALQTLLVAIFSTKLGLFSGNGLAFTLAFIKDQLLDPKAFFTCENIIDGYLSVFQSVSWLPTAIHWVSFATVWYLLVWRTFIHVWTKSRKMNHHENGMSRVATPKEVRSETYKVPDRKYNYGHHAGFPVMHTYNWRGKLNRFVKMQKGATQKALGINNYEIGRLYTVTLITSGIVLFLILCSTAWGAIDYYRGVSVPLLSAFNVVHPIAVLIGWLAIVAIGLIVVFGKVQLVGFHFPFTGTLFYLMELLGIAWLGFHIKDFSWHHKNSAIYAILHNNSSKSLRGWVKDVKKRYRKNFDSDKAKKPIHINNAADKDPYMEDYLHHSYRSDKNSTVKVTDCLFHHPVQTMKLAFMAVACTLVDLDGGTTGWYYLSPRPHNVWIYGTSGSGKDQMAVNPMMDINSRADDVDKPNMIVTDPKGESAAGAAVMLKKRGYNVKVMNILDMSHSMSFNPLRLVIKYAQLGAISKAEDACIELSSTIYDPGAESQNAFFYSSSANVFDALTFALIALAHSRYYGLDDLVTYHGQKVYDDGAYRKGSTIDSAGDHVQKLSDGKYHSDKNAFSKVTIHNISEMVATLGGQEGRKAGEQEPEKRLIIYFDHLSNELGDLVAKINEGEASEVERDQKTILDQAVQKFQQSKMAGSKEAGTIYTTLLDRLRIYMSSGVAKMTSMDNFNPAEMGFDRLLTLQFSRLFKLQHITTKSWYAIEKNGQPALVLKNSHNEPIDANGKPIVKYSKIVDANGLPTSDWKKRLQDYVFNPYAKELESGVHKSAKAFAYAETLWAESKAKMSKSNQHWGYTRKPVGHIETNKGHLSEIGVGHIPFEKPIYGKIFFVTIDLHDERVDKDFYFEFQCRKNYYTPASYLRLRHDYKKAPQVADLEIAYRTKKHGKISYSSSQLGTKVVINKYTEKPALKRVSIKMVHWPGAAEYESLGKSKLRIFADKPKAVFVSQQTHFLYNPHPTAWFIVVPQNKRELNQLGTFAIEQTFNVLNGIAISFTNKRCVQRPLQMILDELGNLPAIRDLDSIASFGRSQHVNIMPIFQSKAQADNIYKSGSSNKARVIYENCPTTVYILSNSEETIKDISAGFGNRTVTNTTRSYDPAKIKSINYNENEMKQDVMPPDVLRNLRLGEEAILRTTDRDNVWGRDTDPWPIFDWDGHRDQPDGKLKKVGPDHSMPFAWTFLDFSHGSLSSVPIVTPHKYLDLSSLTIDFDRVFIWMESKDPEDQSLVSDLVEKYQNRIAKWKNTTLYKFFAMDLQIAEVDVKDKKDEAKALKELAHLDKRLNADRSAGLLHLGRGIQVGFFVLNLIHHYNDLNVLSQNDINTVPPLKVTAIFDIVNKVYNVVISNHLLYGLFNRDTPGMNSYKEVALSLNEMGNEYLADLRLIDPNKDNRLTPKAKKLINNTNQIGPMLAKESINYDSHIPLSKLLASVIDGLKVPKDDSKYRGFLFLCHLMNDKLVQGFSTDQDNIDHDISVDVYSALMLTMFDVYDGKVNDDDFRNNLKTPLHISNAGGTLLENLSRQNDSLKIK